MDIDALGEAERELMMIEKDLNEAEAVFPLFLYHFEFVIVAGLWNSLFPTCIQKKKHFEEVMTTKVLSEIEAAKAQCSELEQHRKVTPLLNA